MPVFGIFLLIKSRKTEELLPPKYDMAAHIYFVYLIFIIIDYIVFIDMSFEFVNNF